VKLDLVRQERSAGWTLGELLVDGAHECWTLEDTVRERDGEAVGNWKIPGQTAIPRGTYDVVVTFSNRFQRDLPLLQDVPGFAGVRIHPGNTAKDTEGCILVGAGKQYGMVTESRVAFQKLFDRIAWACNNGERVTIEIV